MPARRTRSHGKAMEVAAMSLSAREEQILGSIEDGLARSDPKLAWMLATFTRLVSGEEMPVREKIRAVRLAANLRDRRQPRQDDTPRRAHRLGQRLGLPRYGVLWLAAVAYAALVAIALVVSHGGRPSDQGSCSLSWPAACTGQVSAHPSGSEAHKAASDQWSRAGWVPAAGRVGSSLRSQGLSAPWSAVITTGHSGPEVPASSRR